MLNCLIQLQKRRSAIKIFESFHFSHFQQNQVNHSSNDFRSLFKTDMNKYLHTAFPRDYAGFAQCHIKREKGISTIFSLYLDGQNESDQVCIRFLRVTAYSIFIRLTFSRFFS